jgi:hypothetical protein
MTDIVGVRGRAEYTLYLHLGKIAVYELILICALDTKHKQQKPPKAKSISRNAEREKIDL